VIHDDASTDGTRERLRIWAARDPRVKLHESEVNQGNRVAMLAAVSQARAPVAAIMDTDDLARPGRWFRTVEAMEASPRWLGLFGDAEFIDGEDRPVTPWLFARDQQALRRMAEFGMPAINSTSAWRTEWLRARLAEAPVPATYDYYLLAWALTEGEVGWVPEVLVRYRMHAANYSHRFRGRQFAHGTALRLWAAQHRAGQNGDGPGLIRWADDMVDQGLDEGGMDAAAGREAWRLGLARPAVYHVRRAIRRGHWREGALLARILASPRAWRQNIGPVLRGGWLGGAGVDRSGFSRG